MESEKQQEITPDLRSSEERRKDGTFAPGRSPNPGGQAKWLQPLKAELRAGVPKVLARLMTIITDGEHKDSVAAGRVWLEYSLPKPKQTLKVSGSSASPLAGLPLEDLIALGRGVKAAEGGALVAPSSAGETPPTHEAPET